jgi:hypothetical protein
MEMINRCLEVTEAQRAALEQFDKRHSHREQMIAKRGETRSPEFGNRKARRRQAALERLKATARS